MGQAPNVLFGASPIFEAEHGGIRQVLRILRESPQPVVINVIGSCRDIAIAGKMAPDLFAQKCARIYLNAGAGSRDKEKAKKLEYNVGLEPAAYAAIFDLPCPVYWMPCFEEVHPEQKEKMWTVREFGTFYRFRHDDVLPHLSTKAQNFFTFMYRERRGRELKTEIGIHWLQNLLGPPDSAELTRLQTTYRNMWCTAGFLHAAGLTVTKDGRIVPLAEGVDDAVFTFDPIRVTCDDRGVTEWSPANAPSHRYIFHVRDTDRYQAAMTHALRELLARLP
jgi:hypothetical protein